MAVIGTASKVLGGSNSEDHDVVQGTERSTEHSGPMSLSVLLGKASRLRLQVNYASEMCDKLVPKNKCI